MNYEKWVRHFDRNSKNRPEPDWDAPLKLTGRMLKKLTCSIQQFQLGDGGGPAYLIAWNRDRYLSDPAVKRVIDLWFNEEKEHSRLLGGMLRRLGAEEIQSHWSFSLFCGVRRFLGVRFELQALLGTEIVSNVYYKMLRKHGEDAALRGMCDLIISDETGHISFHRSRLADEGGRGKFGARWSALFRLRALAAGTVLWVNHRGALVALGGNDAEFYRWIWRDTDAFINRLRREAFRSEAVRRVEKGVSAGIVGI
ncbi:MAG: ferritin-like domain-containing protein [Luteolibacter sp.]|uniref:ferritin-like domain-containing protein n=1 Tax=Luteolibacter sp. TaxID=1962973 RepID=UPI003266AA47